MALELLVKVKIKKRTTCHHSEQNKWEIKHRWSRSTSIILLKSNDDGTEEMPENKESWSKWEGKPQPETARSKKHKTSILTS